MVRYLSDFCPSARDVSILKIADGSLEFFDPNQSQPIIELVLSTVVLSGRRGGELCLQRFAISYREGDDTRER